MCVCVCVGVRVKAGAGERNWLEGLWTCRRGQQMLRRSLVRRTRADQAFRYSLGQQITNLDGNLEIFGMWGW